MAGVESSLRNVLGALLVVAVATGSAGVLAQQAPVRVTGTTTTTATVRPTTPPGVMRPPGFATLPSVTPRRCTVTGEHDSAGHCCATGAEWVPARNTCMCLTLGEHESGGHCCSNGWEWVPARSACVCLTAACVCGTVATPPPAPVSADAGVSTAADASTGP